MLLLMYALVLLCTLIPPLQCYFEIISVFDCYLGLTSVRLRITTNLAGYDLLSGSLIKFFKQSIGIWNSLNRQFWRLNFYTTMVLAKIKYFLFLFFEKNDKNALLKLQAVTSYTVITHQSVRRC